MTKIDESLAKEGEAWEDEWKKTIPPKNLTSYRKNMKIFKKLGFWEESAEAARYIPSNRGWTVLDLGCGNGKSTANIVGKNVFGVDLSVKQLAIAREKFPERQFLVADATKLPFKSNVFDLIVMINVLHHLGNKPRRCLKECYRVLKRGGILLTVDPNLTNPFGFMMREGYKIFNLKKIFPSFPQFALQADEYQFTKGEYFKLFRSSPFKEFSIYPHRAERVLFFMSILIPAISQIPGYETTMLFVSKIGNLLVSITGFDRLCYFWKGRAVK